MLPRRLVAVPLLAGLLLILLTIGPVFAQDVTPEATPEAIANPIVESTLEATTEPLPAAPLQQPESTPETTVAADVQAPAAATSTSTATATLVPGNFASYTVVQGDTLARIAQRFNTTISTLAADNGIVNPNLIFAGQTLRIRGAQQGTPTPTSTAQATATVIPGSTTSYTVRNGDNLFRIALRNNTTVAQLASLNNLTNPNLIYIGQVLQVPAGGSLAGANAPATTPETSAPAATATSEPSSVTAATAIPAAQASFAYGIEASFPPDNAANVAAAVAELGMSWVKVNVQWRNYETTEGQIDFASLDAIVGALEAENLNILFNVTTAPDWARTSDAENGPPDDLTDYANFVGALAQRYAGRVAAYEIWTEPNLRREWNSTVYSISATSYLQLLQGAYSAIKSADPGAIVVSAGLAPTGFNDGVNAINDRLYLAALYESGLADVSDAIGAHPAGFANPPDALCCEPSVGVETHYEDPSFYFLQTLDDYRTIMLRYNDGDTAIWVTSFGWGTSEDTGAPSSVYIFVTYTSLTEQAIYTPRAYELAQVLGYVGPMFLNNLNACVADPGNVEACYFSLIGTNGTPRPVMSAVQNISKGGAAAPDLTTTEEVGVDTTGADTTTGSDSLSGGDTTSAGGEPATTPEATG